MLIKELINSKEKLSNGNIEEIVSLEDLFNCKNNTFVKDVLKQYEKQGKGMIVRIFIQDKIELFRREKQRQLTSENENQRLSYKANSDLLLKDILRFMNHAERADIDLLAVTTNLVTVLDDFNIQYCVPLNIDKEEIISREAHNQVLQMCNKTNASIVIYLYPFFEDRGCLDSYINATKHNMDIIKSPEFSLINLRNAKHALEKNTFMLTDEQSLTGEDLKYLYTKLKDVIFEKTDNYELLRMYKHKETSFVITERNTTDLFLSLIERNNFRLICEILDENNNAFKDHKKLLNKLGPNLLNTLMQLALENNNSDISTLLYTSTKATHSKEQEFFNLIKVRESFNNILKTIEYLIGEYNHSTKDKEKYAMKINDLVDSLLVNIEDLQEEMSEGCNEYFEHHLVNYIDYICLIFPKNLNNTKITAISETIHLDYYPLPEFEKED